MSVPTFQPVNPAQAEELLAAVREYYAEDEIPFDAALVRPALARLLADPTLGRACWIVDAEGARAGYMVWTFGFDHEAGGPLAAVTDLFVHPGHQRRGLARAALGFVAQACRALGCAGWSCRWSGTTRRAGRCTRASASGRTTGRRCF